MKYFFFDIDGTLTDFYSGKLIESGLEAIRQLQQQGHFVAIATGRAHYKTMETARKAGIHNYVCNGGAGLVVDDVLVKNPPLDKHKALQIIREADELGYGILVSFNDSIDVLMKDHRFLEQYGERKEATNYIYDPDLDFADIENIYKFYISLPKEEEDRIKDLDLLPHLRIGDSYIWWQYDQKDQGIIDMVSYVNGDLREVVVFGDGSNDLVMFKDEWTCIAMGGGDPELQARADYVTDTPLNDGLAKACRHFGWIQ